MIARGSNSAGHLLRLRAVPVHDRGLPHAHAAAALPHEAVRHHRRCLHGARSGGLGCIQAAKPFVWSQISHQAYKKYTYIHTFIHTSFIQHHIVDLFLKYMYIRKKVLKQLLGLRIVILFRTSSSVPKITLHFWQLAVQKWFVCSLFFPSSFRFVFFVR